MANNGWEVAEAPLGKQGKSIQDFLYFEGLFNPVLRFAFTNVTDKVFESKWNGVPYKVQPGQTVKLQHYLAVKFTKEIVDRMMQDENRGLAMAVPASRKPYEDKVLTLLPPENSMELEVIKNDFVEQVNRDAQRKEGEPDAQSPAETIALDFEDIRNRTETSSPEGEERPRRGRPRKS